MYLGHAIVWPPPVKSQWNPKKQETPVEKSAELFLLSSWGAHQPFVNLLGTSNQPQTRASDIGGKGKMQNHPRPSTSMARASAILTHHLLG